MKPEAQAVMLARVNIDVLPHVVGNKLLGMGIRLRPYGKNSSKDVMILGYGTSFEGALEECYAKAYGNRWESLQWAARPWETAAADTESDPFAGPTNPF